MRLSQPPPGAAVTSATAAGSRRPVPFSRPEGGGSARAPGAGPAPTGPATAPARPAAVEAQRTRPVPAAAHPVHVNTGSFRVVGSPPTAPTSVPVSSPPVPFAAPPPAVIPRLPDAALVLLVEARAAMARAEVELSDVDARANNPASMRNAMVYAAYAGVFAFVQLPMTAMLSASDRLPTILGAPCGLSSVVLSFILAWLTIGFLYQQPGGQRPPRSPMLGAVISLIAAVPVVAAVAWTVWSAVSD
jgi:hypothetical protein